MRIGYARVSTEEQNLDMQTAALETAGCDEIFTDHGVSGTTTKRPGLDKAIAQLGEGDSLVVWKLDRLGRSTHHLLTLIEGLEKRGVGFATLTEQIETKTPAGRMYLRVFAALAQLERSMIAERTREGLKAVRARGVKLGRPQMLTNDQLRYAATEHEAKRQTQTSLAAMFGVDKTTLSKALKRWRENGGGDG